MRFRRLIPRAVYIITALLFFVPFSILQLQAAETSSRQSQWEMTLAAAKKEGKVNVYMYRYGKVLDVFRSDYPEIRPFLLAGTDHGGTAGREKSRGCHRTGLFELSNLAPAS